MGETKKLVVTGAAGLVGQNLVLRLKERGYTDIVCIDKHQANTAVLRQLHPDLEIIDADLSVAGSWQSAFDSADCVVLNHAQIGGLDEAPFIANNVVATERVIEAAKAHNVPYIVHISSSVVNSLAHDFYTESKKAQEKLVLESGLPACVLRPTLMFGWFDRKHLGWLARFMKKVPLFPMPGNGRYLRQPLYVGDFCNIIMAAIAEPRPDTVFNITGQEKVFYVDLMRAVRDAAGSKTPIVRIPYWLFDVMLRIYSVIDRNPPFTNKQLKALVTPDVFEVIDWPKIFGVAHTPLSSALDETFNHPVYSDVILEF